jgi:hypothetical protein
MAVYHYKGGTRTKLVKTGNTYSVPTSKKTTSKKSDSSKTTKTISKTTSSVSKPVTIDPKTGKKTTKTIKGATKTTTQKYEDDKLVSEVTKVKREEAPLAEKPTPPPVPPPSPSTLPEGAVRVGRDRVRYQGVTYDEESFQAMQARGLESAKYDAPNKEEIQYKSVLSELAQGDDAYYDDRTGTFRILHQKGSVGHEKIKSLLTNTPKGWGAEVLPDGSIRVGEVIPEQKIPPQALAVKGEGEAPPPSAPSGTPYVNPDKDKFMPKENMFTRGTTEGQKAADIIYGALVSYASKDDPKYVDPRAVSIAGKFSGDPEYEEYEAVTVRPVHPLTGIQEILELKGYEEMRADMGNTPEAYRRQERRLAEKRRENPFYKGMREGVDSMTQDAKPLGQIPVVGELGVKFASNVLGSIAEAPENIMGIGEKLALNVEWHHSGDPEKREVLKQVQAEDIQRVEEGLTVQAEKAQSLAYLSPVYIGMAYGSGDTEAMGNVDEGTAFATGLAEWAFTDLYASIFASAMVAHGVGAAGKWVGKKLPTKTTSGAVHVQRVSADVKGGKIAGGDTYARVKTKGFFGGEQTAYYRGTWDSAVSNTDDVLQYADDFADDVPIQSMTTGKGTIYHAGKEIPSSGHSLVSPKIQSPAEVVRTGSGWTYKPAQDYYVGIGWTESAGKGYLSRNVITHVGKTGEMPLDVTGKGVYDPNAVFPIKGASVDIVQGSYVGKGTGISETISVTYVPEEAIPGITPKWTYKPEASGAGVGMGTGGTGIVQKQQIIQETGQNLVIPFEKMIGLTQKEAIASQSAVLQETGQMGANILGNVASAGRYLSRQKSLDKTKMKDVTPQITETIQPPIAEEGQRYKPKVLVGGETKTELDTSQLPKSLARVTSREKGKEKTKEQTKIKPEEKIRPREITVPRVKPTQETKLATAQVTGQQTKLKAPPVQIQTEIEMTKIPGQEVEVQYQPPAPPIPPTLPNMGMGGGASGKERKFLPKTAEKKVGVKKAPPRSLYSDLLSVTRTQFKHGKATHPSLKKRPEVWEYGKNPLGRVPTVEMLEAKKKKKKKKEFVSKQSVTFKKQKNPFKKKKKKKWF